MPVDDEIDAGTTSDDDAGSVEHALDSSVSMKEPLPCEDGVKNGAEIDVDCGGTCGLCPNGRTCLSGEDCASTHCNVALAICVSTACDDGVHNGAETSIDCGGEACLACPGGVTCAVDSDCISGSCDEGDHTCAPTWSSIDTTVPGGLPVAWTGTHILYLLQSGGGWSYELATGDTAPISAVGAPVFDHPTKHGGVMIQGRLVVIVDSALYAYEPIANAWTALGKPFAYDGYILQLVAAGATLYVVGESKVAAVNPVSGAWKNVAAMPSPRRNYAPGTRSVWTGSRLLVWNAYHGHGAAYDPTKNEWSRISKTGAPSGRYSATATWIDDRMVFLGGYTGNDPYPGYLNDGRAYDPGSKQWTSTATFRVPPPRAAHVAVLHGGDLYVFGGQTFTDDDCASGSAYTASTDSWAPMDFAGGPCLSNSDPHHTRVLTFWSGGKLYAADVASQLWVYAPK